jgi:hypothetical protein
MEIKLAWWVSWSEDHHCFRWNVDLHQSTPLRESVCVYTGFKEGRTENSWYNNLLLIKYKKMETH